MALIFFINQFVLPSDSSINVGLNAVSFLTSGSLGIPGVCLLYGIMCYNILWLFYKKDFFQISGWTNENGLVIMRLTQQSFICWSIRLRGRTMYRKAGTRGPAVVYFYSGCMIAAIFKSMQIKKTEENGRAVHLVICECPVCLCWKSSQNT